MRITERGRGPGDWARDLRRLEENLTAAAMHARIDSVVQEFTDALRATMPVRSGALKGSGGWTSQADENSYEADVTFGGAGAPYAPYVIGRWINGEHPWDDVLPAFEERFEAAISSAWDDAMGR